MVAISLWLLFLAQQSAAREKGFVPKYDHSQQSGIISLVAVSCARKCKQIVTIQLGGYLLDNLPSFNLLETVI